MDTRALAAEVHDATGLALVDGQLLRQGRRATTLRYGVEGTTGEHVIVKHAADPTAATFRREAAALRVLPGCSTAVARVPRLLHDLAAQGVLIIEDLSPARTLETLLEHASPEERREALLRVAHGLGQLHGAARGRRGALDDRAAGATARERQADQLRRAEPAVDAFLTAVGVAVDPGLTHAIERLAESVVDDAALATITVGDMAPSNVLLLDGERVAFIDFEHSGVRHPFYDAMFWRCIFPLEPRVSDAMEARYRLGLQELGLSMDELAFQRDMTRLVCQRLLWMLSWDMQALLKQDRPVVAGGPGLRSVLLHHLWELSRLAHRASHDARIESTLARCLEALLRRWDERPADAAPGDTAVFHIVERDVWDAREGETYRPVSLDTEGFVHLSTASQLLDTARRFYAGRGDLLVLELDERSLGAPLRYEAPVAAAGEPAGTLFPHFHAAVPVAAVRRVGRLLLQADGSFEWLRDSA